MFNIYATDYAPVDPITPPCDITPIFIGYKGENKARCLIFDLTECVETFGDGGFVISFIRQGDDLPYLVTDTDRLDNHAIWIITDTDTAVDGYGMVQLQYIVDDVVCKSALYRTVTFDSNSITGDVPDPYEDLLAQIAAYAAQAEGAATTATAAAQAASTAVENGIVTERSQRIAADNGLQLQITELMGLAGAPSMAATAAAMTDSNKVYVYTGSEAGYLNGHWYYYNGTEWADGGVYQATAINTDKTLTVENMAADAAVTGERIDECMAAFVTETVSGSIASFTDGADGVPLKDLVVNIQPKQASGTPSPDNVLPISGWTEANITRCEKNLWDAEAIVASSNHPSFVYISDGYLKFKTGDINYTNLNWKSLNYPAPLMFSGTVKNFATGTNNVRICANYSDGTYTQYVIANGMAENVTADFSLSIGTPGKTITSITGAWTNELEAGFDLANTQLELGSVATEFEPYMGNVYNVSFGSAGTVYGGTLDVTSGMLTVTHGFVDLGSKDWSPDGGSVFRLVSNINAKNVAPNVVPSFVCSAYKTVSQANVSEDKSISGLNWGYGVRVKDTTYGTDAAAFKTGVSGVMLAYELNTYTSYQLTPTEVKTLLGNNNIWSDTGSVSSCEYRADTKLYLEKLTTPDDDMIANANITSGSYFMVGNSLYLATAAIASGASIVPGTNCTLTNLAAALNAINS